MLNVVCGDRVTGAGVVAHPTPQMVSITGSVAAGRAVAVSAGGHLKRTHLELGGKAPVIVFDDADIAAAAEGIAVAGYFNAGQDCTAATRVLARAGVAEELTAALAEQAKGAATTFGRAADDEDAWVPPVNNADQLERILGFLSDVPSHATVAAGGKRQGDKGFYIEPTVIGGLLQDDRHIQEEIFGPVITVQSFADEDEAIALGQRRRVRLGLLGVDQGRVTGAAGLGRAGLRLRVDQHPHPAGRRDAARRLQGLRSRQGPVDVRPRGLHPHQARDGLHRGLTLFPPTDERTRKFE